MPPPYKPDHIKEAYESARSLCRSIDPIEPKRAKELASLVADVPELPPLPDLSEEEGISDDPAPPPHPKKGGGAWKYQPKEALSNEERETITKRVSECGLHRTARHCGVSHATLTKAAKGEALVVEKAASIRLGLCSEIAPKKGSSVPLLLAS